MIESIEHAVIEPSETVFQDRRSGFFTKNFNIAELVFVPSPNQQQTPIKATLDRSCLANEERTSDSPCEAQP